MKKWIVIGAILICCLVYAIVKLSMSENQNVSNQEKETQSKKQINADNTNKATPAEKTQSAKQINAGNIDKATPEEGSGSPVPAVQVEAVTKVYSEFQNALKNEDYEGAWKLTSEFFKSHASFEEFKKVMAGERAQAELVNAIIHPESALYIESRVSLLITSPEEELYFSFIQEDGQWKLYSGQPAKTVDTSKE